MSVLSPTPAERLCDPQGRPYFLWDMDMTLSQFRQALASGDAGVRAYFIAKLMRQAKPDDVFTFVSVAELVAEWPALAPQLGAKLEFWQWVLDTWRAQTHAA